VALIRDAVPGLGLEVLLLMRPANSTFAPRVEVFPGGSVDPADFDPGWTKMAPEVASKSPVATHLLVTAVRETFEECGILLARDEQGEPCPPGLIARLQTLRQGVSDGDPAALRRGLRDHGLRPAWEDLYFCAHWVTPDGLPRIFDTRFFLAGLPTGQRPSGDERREVESLRWTAPGTALEEARCGDAQLLPPTRAVLESLTQHQSVAAALRATAEAVVRRIKPRLEEVTVARYPGLDLSTVRPGPEGDKD